MKLKLLLILILLTIAGLFASQEASAACSPSAGGDLILSSSCSFSGSVDGVDNGNLTINSAVTLTINTNQTIVFNSGKSITLNGTIAISASGAQIKKTNLWMTDADSDNYPSSTTQVAQDSAPANGRRRNLMSTISSTDCLDSNAFTYQNIANLADDTDQDRWYTGTTATRCVGAQSSYWYRDSGGSYQWISSGSAWGTSDCATADATRWSNRYADGDGDTYGAGSLVCVGNHAGYVDNSSDCYDSNANAKPGQTTYYSTNRGDGSFDYNCNSVIDLEYAYARSTFNTTWYIDQPCDVGGFSKPRRIPTESGWCGLNVGQCTASVSGYYTSYNSCGVSLVYCDTWNSAVAFKCR